MFEPSKPRNRTKAIVLGAMLLGGLLSRPASAQSDPATISPVASDFPLAGDWDAVLVFQGTGYHLVLHLNTTPEGKMTALLDHTDHEKISGIPAIGGSFDGRHLILRFNYWKPNSNRDLERRVASYEATVNGSNSEMTGILTQEGSWPLNFKRLTWQAKVPRSAPPTIFDGDWEGVEEEARSLKIHFIFHIHNTGDGLMAILDCPEEEFKGALASKVSYDQHSRRFSITIVGATFAGKMTRDGKALETSMTEPGYHFLIHFDRLGSKKTEPSESATPSDTEGNLPLPVVNFMAVSAFPSAAPSQAKDVRKESRPRILFWNPPDVDARLSAPPGCALSSVVEKAGARALKFVTNLQNFTAEERIEYRALGNAFEEQADVGTFEYTAALGSTNKGYVVQEFRKPAKGSHMFPAATQDVGLTEMALIFLPNFQKIYNMECEGSTEWKDQTVWVVHFRQRTNQLSHLVSLSFGGYPALLKGRAWIAQDSGEVVHMEIGLMRAIPEVGVKEWFLSLDYAPVRFRTRDVQLWLPQSAEAYEDSRARKTIIVHKFSAFQLFSVQTDAVTRSLKPAPQ